MNKTSYIYGLFDPIEQVVRYVGQSIRPGLRLAGHLMNGGRNLQEWVKYLAHSERYPCMIILEICPFETVHEREIHWHYQLADMGLSLLNHPRGSHRTTVFPSSKEYKDRFTYRLHCILEPAYRYRMYYADEPETHARFATILEFAQLTAISPQASERQLP